MQYAIRAEQRGSARWDHLDNPLLKRSIATTACYVLMRKTPPLAEKNEGKNVFSL